MTVGKIIHVHTQHIHDMPDAFVRLTIVLTIPVGLPVGAAAGITMSSQR